MDSAERGDDAEASQEPGDPALGIGRADQRDARAGRPDSTGRGARVGRLTGRTRQACQPDIFRQHLGDLAQDAIPCDTSRERSRQGGDAQVLLRRERQVGLRLLLVDCRVWQRRELSIQGVALCVLLLDRTPGADHQRCQRDRHEGDPAGAAEGDATHRRKAAGLLVLREKVDRTHRASPRSRGRWRWRTSRSDRARAPSSTPSRGRTDLRRGSARRSAARARC